MKRIFDLIERGVFTTRFVTAALTGTAMYLWITGQPLPDDLRAAWLLIMGFWFNSETNKLDKK